MADPCGCDRENKIMCFTHEELAEGHYLTRMMDRADGDY